MMSKDIPLIKEYRITNHLINALECFEEYAYDRTKQRECVLRNYDTTKDKDIRHWDKSIFRGMVIPSLKYLGLAYGEKDLIKTSANGKLLLESKKIDNEFFMKVLRVVVYELDIETYSFLEKLSPTRLVAKNDFYRRVYSEISGGSEPAKRERVTKWLSILEQAKLISVDKFVHLNAAHLEEAQKNVLESEAINTLFVTLLLESYKAISKDSVGIIKIEELRKAVCVNFLYKNKILTESMFDAKLQSIPFETDKYLFSLGKPMGIQEKLFNYKGLLFDTIHIKTP